MKTNKREGHERRIVELKVAIERRKYDRRTQELRKAQVDFQWAITGVWVTVFIVMACIAIGAFK